MPVYGKGRKGKKPGVDGSSVHRAGRKAGREYLVWRWTRESTPFYVIKSVFPGIFGKQGFVSQRFNEKKRPVIVLDWGCGKGIAIRQLARKYGKKVNAYGYSREAYRVWARTKNVKFIHATAEDLPRYLKRDSVDLIYSHMALEHLLESEIREPPGGKRIYALDSESLGYIKKLVSRLSPGGKLCTTYGQAAELYSPELAEQMKGIAEVEANSGNLYLTKKQ